MTTLESLPSIKKSLLLWAVLSLLWGCQKKQYPRISTSSFESYASRSTSLATSAAAGLSALVTDSSLFVALSDEMPFRQEPLPFAQEAVHNKTKVATAESVKKEAESTAYKSGKTQKHDWKTPTLPYKQKATPNKLALLSSVMGIASTLLVIAGLLLSSLPIALIGVPVSIAALILGGVALRKLPKDGSQKNATALALLGVVAGIVIVLAGLTALLLLAVISALTGIEIF